MTERRMEESSYGHVRQSSRFTGKIQGHAYIPDAQVDTWLMYRLCLGERHSWASAILSHMWQECGDISIHKKRYSNSQLSTMKEKWTQENEIHR